MVVAPVSTMVTGVLAVVVPLMTPVASVVVPLVSTVVPAALYSRSAGAAGPAAARVSVEAVWFVFAPVPALTVNVFAPRTTGTAGKVYAPEAFDVALAPVSTMVTGVVGEVVPLMTVVASVVEPLVRWAAPAALKNVTVGETGMFPGVAAAVPVMVAVARRVVPSSPVARTVTVLPRPSPARP